MVALPQPFQRPALWGALALAAANLPVVIKYAGAPGVAIYLAAMCGCAVLAAIGWPRARARLWLALALLLAMAAAQLLLLRYVAPLYDANMDRDDALVLWWQRLAHGAYPYAGPTSGGHRISILPALHLVALPFVALGNVGYLPIVANIALAVLLWRRYAARPGMQALTLLALASAPVINFEVAGRSDIVANMLLYVLLLAWIERVVELLPATAPSQSDLASLKPKQPNVMLNEVKYLNAEPVRCFAPLNMTVRYGDSFSPNQLLWLGLFAGAVAATRFAIWPALVAPMLYLLGHLSWRGRVAVVAGALLGFALLVAPFAIWQPDTFFGYAPFGVNLRKLGFNMASRLFWLALTLVTVVGSSIYAWRTGKLFLASLPVLMCVVLSTWLTFFYDVSYAELLFVPLLCSFARKATS